jgi:hypothetical protein
MSGADPLTAPVPESSADAEASSRALIERQMAMLTRLAEMGMEIAEAATLQARALAQGGEQRPDALDPALAYSRAARAVRLTIALQSRLAKEMAALGEAATRARAVAASQRRNRIHARIEQALAEAERPDTDADEDKIERLSSAAWERLTEEDDAGLLALPVDEVVARICADLGLPPDWAAPAFRPLDPVAPQDAPAQPAPLAAGAASGRRLARSRGPAPEARLSG